MLNKELQVSIIDEDDNGNGVFKKDGLVGLLNDKENLVKFYLDSYFINKCDKIGMHPCDNSATLWLKTSDLISILKENGTIVNIVDL